MADESVCFMAVDVDIKYRIYWNGCGWQVCRCVLERDGDCLFVCWKETDTVLGH